MNSILLVIFAFLYENRFDIFLKRIINISVLAELPKVREIVRHLTKEAVKRQIRAIDDRNFFFARSHYLFHFSRIFNFSRHHFLLFLASMESWNSKKYSSGATFFFISHNSNGIFTELISLCFPLSLASSSFLYSSKGTSADNQQRTSRRMSRGRKDQQRGSFRRRGWFPIDILDTSRISTNE